MEVFSDLRRSCPSVGPSVIDLLIFQKRGFESKISDFSNTIKLTLLESLLREFTAIVRLSNPKLSTVVWLPIPEFNTVVRQPNRKSSAVVRLQNPKFSTVVGLPNPKMNSSPTTQPKVEYCSPNTKPKVEFCSSSTEPTSLLQEFIIGAMYIWLV